MNEGMKNRLREEIYELSHKLNKLNMFMKTEGFYLLDRPNKTELYKQSRVMNEYLEILGRRAEINDVELDMDRIV